MCRQIRTAFHKSKKPRQMCLFGDQFRNWIGSTFALKSFRLEQPHHHKAGNAVEHDGGNHFVSTSPRFQHAGDTAIQRSTNRPSNQCQRNLQPTRPSHHEANPKCNHATCQHLTSRANVEQPSLECHRNC